MDSIDFGTGPQTGDRLPDALKKLQDRLDGFDEQVFQLKIVEKEFSGTTNQTTFISDVDFFTGSVEVFLNGLLLKPSDFSFTNSKTLVLATPLKSTGYVLVASIGLEKGQA